MQAMPLEGASQAARRAGEALRHRRAEHLRGAEGRHACARSRRRTWPRGVTLNQMLVAIYRANQDAFLRENVNWVRAGAILNMPSAEAVGTVDPRKRIASCAPTWQEFRDYRSRLAAVPRWWRRGRTARDHRADRAEARGAKAGRAAGPGAAVQGRSAEAAGAAAARGDDAAARERALKEAQSRIGDLEKNVADLQKLLELKNQQLAELERKAAGAQPTPAAPTSPPAPAPTAAETPKPAAAAEPAPAVKPAAKPVAAKPAPPPAPEPSLLDEFLENPVALAGLARGRASAPRLRARLVWRKKRAPRLGFRTA